MVPFQIAGEPGLKRGEPSGSESSFSFGPDCLIFDVDGVLINTDKSFPEAIRRTVRGEWALAGYEADDAGYSDACNAVFKQHGSFNDDYDIAWTLLNAAASRSAGGRGPRRLSEAIPSPEELRVIISGCPEDSVEWTRRSFGDEFPRERVRRVCADAYFGNDDSAGTFKLESPILDADWKSLPLPAYIYTGRDMREWELARKVLSWEDFPDERVINSDSGIRKPSPEGILRICKRFGHDRPAFFGDTASDRLAQSASGMGWFVAVGGILKDDKLWFKSVPEALSILMGWSR
ncbi:MAG: HAD family hydrolase [Synergistaceae bacterium]|nr:HAD family hydrolase [Synergistaceae bacterium]